MDKWLHPLYSVGWNYLSIPKLQRYNGTSWQTMLSNTLSILGVVVYNHYAIFPEAYFQGSDWK